MEEAVIHKIRNKITRAKFGEVFFVSSFPKYDVEYVTKLLAQFEKMPGGQVSGFWLLENVELRTVELTKYKG